MSQPDVNDLSTAAALPPSCQRLPEMYTHLNPPRQYITPNLTCKLFKSLLAFPEPFEPNGKILRGGAKWATRPPCRNSPCKMAYGCGAREMLGRAPPSSFCTQSRGHHGPPVPHRMTELLFCIGISSRFQEKSSVLQVFQHRFSEQQGAFRINSLRFFSSPRLYYFDRSLLLQNRAACGVASR